MESKPKTQSQRGKQGGRFRDREDRDEEGRVPFDRVKVDLPEGMKKVPKPDDEAQKKLRAEIDAEIEAKQAEMAAVEAKLKAMREGRKEGSAAGSPGTPGQSEYEATQKRISDLKNERKGLHDQVTAIQTKVTQQQDAEKAVRSKLPDKVTNLEELDNRIKEMERKMESGTLSLPDEKKTLNTINAMKVARKDVKIFNDLRDAIAEARKQQKALRDRLDVVNAELTQLISAEKQRYEERKKHNEEGNAERQKVQDMYDQKSQLYQDIKALKEKRWQADQEFRAKRDEYFNFQREYKKLLDAAYDKARKDRDLEKKLRVEREQLSRTPLGNELDMTERLIAYFKGLLPKKVESGPVAAAAPVVSRESTVKEATNLLQRDESDCFSFGTKKTKGKKAAKQADAPTNTKLTLSLDAIQMCGSLGINPPMQTSELENSISLVEAKKAELKTRSAAMRENRLRKYYQKYGSVPEGVDVPAGLDLGSAMEGPVEAEPEVEPEVEEKTEQKTEEVTKTEEPVVAEASA